MRVELVREAFTPDLAGHVNKQMTILMDGMYPKMVSQWTRTKQEQMVAHGYFCGGVVPFGYDKQIIGDVPASRHDKEPPKRLVPDPLTAPFVRRAFEVYTQTRSYNRVVDYLRSVTERSWSLDNVTYLLRNEVYRGVIRYGKNVNYTAHEPLVSEALWDAVRQVDQDRSTYRKQHPKDSTPYYLRGLVYCAHCGCRMTPAGHHGMTAKVRYYECLCAKKKQTRGCPSPRVNAQALHTALLTEIARAAKHPTRIQGYLNAAVKQLPDTSGLKSEATAIKKRLAEIDRRIERVQTAIEVGTGELLPLVQRLEVLANERLSVEEEHLRLEAQQSAQGKGRPDPKEIASLWRRFLELWDKLTEEEREQVMLHLVERVDIHSKEEGTCRIRISGQVPFSNV